MSDVPARRFASDIEGNRGELCSGEQGGNNSYC